MIMSDHSVAFAKCGSYDVNLHESIARVVDLLGGIGSFISRDQSVLIKPNMLSDRKPESAVTTHPQVVRALIRMTRDFGARPFVADGPANATKVEKVWETTGFRALCNEENVPLVNLSESGSSRVEIDGYVFNISNAVLNADAIINVPKIKTHVLTMFTAAVKNMYGIIPGFMKTTLHKRYPTPHEFGGLLHALYKAVPPTLSVADGVIGMDGDGPSGGSPVRLGFVAAAHDSADLDIAVCRILGINPMSVDYLARITAVGAHSEEMIQYLGDPITELRPASFKIPNVSMASFVPNWLARIVAPFIWFRPAISDKCIGCGQCVKVCPANALKLSDGKALLDSTKCIGCCCCHEVCPEKAITMRMSPLLNLVRKGRLP
ncbi:MAG: DUF362 domain-containing protein [Lentisphaerae bacterium]|nr:DUF362 domain-containing protein [Lentisphaerota bacterium]